MMCGCCIYFSFLFVVLMLFCCYFVLFIGPLLFFFCLRVYDSYARSIVHVMFYHELCCWRRLLLCLCFFIV